MAGVIYSKPRSQKKFITQNLLNFWIRTQESVAHKRANYNTVMANLLSFFVSERVVFTIIGERNSQNGNSQKVQIDISNQYYQGY